MQFARARTSVWVLALLAVFALVVSLTPMLAGQGADHLDAPNLMSPSGRTQADINDVYAFQGATATDTVLAVTVHPVANATSSFGADVLYEVKIDNAGDANEDISYEVTFSSVKPNGAQYFLVQRSTGAQSADGVQNGALVAYGRVGKTVPVAGGGSFFAGLRSDPFFFDLDAFRNVVGMGNLTTGRQFNDANKSDFFLPLDTLALVLEVPDSVIPGPIKVWAETSVAGTQIDRMGRPAINTVVNDSGPLVMAPADNKNVYNSTHPKDDAQYKPFAVAALQALSSIDSEGSYSATEAGALADLLLPDVLPYDKAGTLPPPLNGRPLNADVISTELNIVTGGDPLDLFAGRDANGAITTQGLSAHGDYLSGFPYLGAPHATAPAAPASASSFIADLRGSNEVPPVSTGAGGVTGMRVDGSNLLVWTTTHELTNTTAAHIHIGDAGKNGPVATFIYMPASATTSDGLLPAATVNNSTLVAGTLTDLIEVMTGGFAYVNAHTTANPGGEIRGQVVGLNAGTVGARFSDDNGNPHEANIELIAEASITLGTGPTTYDPSRSITRGEMAAFLNRAFNFAPASTDPFTDDENSQFEADINAVAAAGITTGTTATTFSPNDPVTREQMAAFLVRALVLADVTTDSFTDDEASFAEDEINALAASGITKGTSATLFSPGAPVLRDQMASFLARAVGLTTG
ncbi:MAG: DUF4331 family protein [Acidimicrobiia bacterium]